jgi:predicted DNA-binding antitoxin AbrB/MazE fold protein
MTVVRARYENGNLVPARALPLAPGEDVSIVVLRVSRAARWDLSRLAALSDEEEFLSEAGLRDWADSLDAEDEA